MSLDTTRYAYELVRITQELYPKQFVSHCFEAEIYELRIHYKAADLLLLEDLIIALTLLNQRNRVVDDKYILATREDFINALYLISPIALRLRVKDYELLQELYKVFGFEPFNYFDVEFKMNHSKSKSQRILKPLIHHNLLIRGMRSGVFNRIEIRLNEAVFEEYTKPIFEEKNIFDIMNEDWDEFQGFNDCQMRT